MGSVGGMLQSLNNDWDHFGPNRYSLVLPTFPQVLAANTVFIGDLQK